MKILTFCAYYEPEIAASMYLLTNLFEDAANSGIEVDLYAPTPTRGVDKETIQKYKHKKKEILCNNNLNINRFAMIQEGKNTIGRALRYILVNGAFLWKGLHADADVLFVDSTPPTQGLVAALLKKIKKIPVVYNLQDIFPDSLVNTGICSKNSIFFKIGSWIEQITYRNADKIIVISEDFKKNIISKGVPEDKIEVVYNWVDGECVNYIEKKDNQLFDEFCLDREKFYVSYSGNIGLTQNMELLIQAAVQLQNIDDIGFIVIGDGAYKEELQRQIIEKNLKNITLIPFQPYTRISEVFSIGDVGLIISKPGIGTNSVPSKTWSYMAAERPLLASFDLKSELSQIISTNQCGESIRPDDCECLVKTILMMKENPQILREQGNKGRKFVDRNLKRDIGTGRYIKCIEKSIDLWKMRK